MVYILYFIFLVYLFIFFIKEAQKIALMTLKISINNLTTDLTNLYITKLAQMISIDTNRLKTNVCFHKIFLDCYNMESIVPLIPIHTIQKIQHFLAYCFYQ